MKILSWNVNWVRAVMKKGFLDYFFNESPDMICMQEVKAQEDEFPARLDVEMAWYKVFWNSAVKKWYSWTAILSKTQPLSVSYWLWMPEHDEEWRVITCEYENFFLVNVYTPNSKRELERLDYRQLWDSLFLDYLKRLELDKPVVVCWDLNVAHKEIDLENPSANRHNAWFTDEERAWIQKFLDNWFIDTFRYLYPEDRKRYTWWSNFANSRERNIWWRIDYFLVSESLKWKLEKAYIHDNILWSDHCPIWIELKWV